MSIADTDVVDLVTIDAATDNAILTIADHLEWGIDDLNHMWLLQEKLNKYLAFIEGGELSSSYPTYAGRKIKIRVIGKYPLTEEAQSFYEKVKDIIGVAGFDFEFKKFESE